METGLGAALSGVQTQINGAVADALPVAGAVFASLAGILIGFKFFKKITGARS